MILQTKANNNSFNHNLVDRYMQFNMKSANCKICFVENNKLLASSTDKRHSSFTSVVFQEIDYQLFVIQHVTNISVPTHYHIRYL